MIAEHESVRWPKLGVHGIDFFRGRARGRELCRAGRHAKRACLKVTLGKGLFFFGRGLSVFSQGILVPAGCEKLHAHAVMSGSCDA